LVDPYRIVRDGPQLEAIEIQPFHAIPENVHIEITYACMEDCIMCYNPTRTKVNERDKQLVWSIVRQMGQARVPHTYLIGGEPTYGYSTSELRDMVEYLSDNGSSVTIVTNGQITLKGMTPRLACYGVSVHGADAESHDFITRRPRSFDRAIASIRQYVEEGHDVRIIPVVMGRNHDQMYAIAELAWELGAESLYYDVYEPGGIGEENSHLQDLNMAPSYPQLMTAIDQIIAAHDDFPFKGSVGFGTALPYCLHPGLAERRMLANCGVGTYFGAVTSQGQFRICNQSKMNFGNVLDQSLSDIWLSEELTEVYRRLKWVQEPCASCAVLKDCGGGCKVDEGCASGELCIDRNVRGLPPELQQRLTMEDVQHGLPNHTVPHEFRTVRATSWLDVTDTYKGMDKFWPGGDRWVKTRYQTVGINASEAAVIRSLMQAGTVDERALVATYGDVFPEEQLRQLVSQLIAIEGLTVVN
jgi:radical SAM protein with 4Fe4S-binding SPASM domain